MYTSGKVLGISTAATGVGAMSVLPQTSGFTLASITIVLFTFLAVWAGVYLLVEYLLKKATIRKK